MRCVLLAPIVVAVALIPARPVAAEEIYVCDGGRLVYVKPGELETLKKTDACIAGYFGQTAAPAAEGTKPADSAPTLRGTADFSDEALAPQDTAHSQPVPGGRRPSGRLAAAENLRLPRLEGETAVASRGVSIPGEGYREVQILNAKEGEATIYRHER